MISLVADLKKTTVVEAKLLILGTISFPSEKRSKSSRVVDVLIT